MANPDHEAETSDNDHRQDWREKYSKKNKSIFFILFHLLWVTVITHEIILTNYYGYYCAPIKNKGIDRNQLNPPLYD